MWPAFGSKNLRRDTSMTAQNIALDTNSNPGPNPAPDPTHIPGKLQVCPETIWCVVFGKSDRPR